MWEEMDYKPGLLLENLGEMPKKDQEIQIGVVYLR